MPQALKLEAVDTMPLRLEPLLEQAREREIHVVAAEENVLADGNALQREIAVLFGHGDQAEIGRAAADVADENQIADTDPAAPFVTHRVEPGIESRLRFFEQRDILEARRLSGAQRQLTGRLVERRGHRQQHVLSAQALLFRAAGNVMIEGCREMPQIRRRRVDCRHVRDLRRRAEGQDRRRSVRAAVRQPGLRAGNDPRRILCPALPSELADDSRRLLVPGQGQAALRKIELTR